MTRRPVTSILGTILILACTSPVDPSPLYPGYSLMRVDDQFLPVPWGEDGSVLISASLLFGGEMRPREPAPPNGTVQYTLWIRMPDYTVQRSTVDLDYTIENAELRINLCPPLALCITTTELVGPVSDPSLELVLTHYVGGTPGTVYRYSAALPE